MFAPKIQEEEREYRGQKYIAYIMNRGFFFYRFFSFCFARVYDNVDTALKSRNKARLEFTVLGLPSIKLTGGNGAQRNCRPVQRLVSHRFHRLMALMRSARFSNSCASLSRFVARYRTAMFSRLVATLGWSGPSAFSTMASERL